MRRTRSKKPSPVGKMFAIAVDDKGNEISIGRVETFASLREMVLMNMAEGLFTEVTILNLRQLDTVVKRITE